MTPTYRIEAENQDITARIAARLVSLSITDNSGDQADTLRLTLENADGRLILPDPGAVLRVWLGGVGYPLRDMGLYSLDEVRESGPPSQVTLTAKAAAFAGGSAAADYTPLQTKKTRSWEAGTTVAAMVQTMAQEAKLTPVVTTTAAALVLPHIDQTEESDLNLLQRIADANDSWAKPAFGKLIFAHAEDVRKPATATASTAPVSVSKEDVSTYEFTRKARQHFETVIAVWRDIEGARDVEERIGPESGPTERISGLFPDADSARKAAASRLEDLQRAGTTFNLTMPAPATLPFYAEGSITAAGFSEKINGAWKLSTVEWNLNDSGMVVALKAEVATEDM